MYKLPVKSKGKEVILSIHDTSGQENYEELRKLSYQGANLFLVCYQVTEPATFKNIEVYWFPEIRKEVPRAPVILCGNKLDLATEKGEKVTEEDASEKMDLLGAFGSYQCSAKDYASDKSKGRVKEVFDAIVKCGLETLGDSKKQTICSLL